MTSLNGAVVLITGANGGIGTHFVQEALARGAAKVYATARTPRTWSDAREGGVVDVSVGASGVEGGGVEVVQRGIRAETFDDIGVGERESAQWSDVGESRVDVVGDLFPLASVPDDQDGCRPCVTQGAQQLVVAEVMDVQVREVQGRELTDEMPVLSADVLCVPLVDAAEGERR